ncbi:COMM domain-containing protein 3 isoform X2 [Xyrichtys novacula]|uniref:COMM domain-containing protein 3 isoform X2 n=1 Tax=Xyrichtys novacula TaxID=13765 RepID=A0AAV1HCE3_XYRNO|nr:COMM domain-containing protein 3 isoform X2 [Xyrichtys novacula]
MELSESVQRGLQSLADPSSFDQSSFQALVEVSFRSLLSSHSDPGVLDQPELKHIDQILLKQTHTAATTFILEAVKHNSDKSTISSCLEELTLSPERIEIFYSAYQKHKKELERLLARALRSIRSTSLSTPFHSTLRMEDPRKISTSPARPSSYRIWWESSKTLPRVWRKPVRCDAGVPFPRLFCTNFCSFQLRFSSLYMFFYIPHIDVPYLNI